MRIGEFIPFMEKAIKAKKRVMRVGKPGCGKTFGTMQAAEHVSHDYIGICSALEDPSTIRGYPSRGVDGRATHCLFDGIARAFDAKTPTVLDFDDLGMASEATARSIMRLFQFGEIDGRKLPDHVLLTAATNDVAQGCGVYGMIEPLKDRFHTIVQVETNLDDVMAYAMSRDWPSDLMAYLRNSPDALHDWVPEKSMKRGGATPRGWDYVAEWVRDGFADDPNTASEVLGGAVGKGRAASYLSFRELCNELPDVDQCIMDPEGSPVPENKSAQWLISMALATKMTAGNFGQAVKYLNRLPAMFRAFSIRDAFRGEVQRRKDGKLPAGWKALATSRDFTAWATSSDGKDVMAAAS